MEKVICYTDGEARGNPGPAGIGVYITDEAGKVIAQEKQKIGNSTDNFAEYNAVMLGLQTLKEKYGKDTENTQFEIRLNSELVKKQLNGEYQINEPGFVPMFIEIHNMRVASFPHLTFIYVSPEQNKEANRLVNEALDGK